MTEMLTEHSHQCTITSDNNANYRLNWKLCIVYTLLLPLYMQNLFLFIKMDKTYYADELTYIQIFFPLFFLDTLEQNSYKSKIVTQLRNEQDQENVPLHNCPPVVP